MRIVVTLAVAVTFVASLGACRDDASEPPRAGQRSGGPLIGIVWGPRVSWAMRGGRLVALDPRLEPRPRRQIRLGPYGYSAAFSPDDSRLALGGFRAGIRIVDAATRRTIRDLTLGAGGLVLGLAWADATRLVAVIGPALGHEGRIRVVTVDVGRGRVLEAQTVPGRFDVLDVEPVGAHELVLLRSPPGRIGPAELVHVDTRGTRAFRLPVAAGLASAHRGAPGRSVTPGLAVDADAGIAYVVAGDDAVVSVAMRSGETAIHRPRRQRSLLRRLADWMQPDAHAKGGIGSWREAAWLGEGVVAVSGHDVGADSRWSPAGLRLIDTGTWTAATIDKRSSRVLAWQGLAVAFGGEGRGGHSAPGIAAFTARGERVWHRFDEQVVHSAQAASVLVYANLAGRAVALELATGRTVREVRSPLPRLLIAD